MREAIAAGERAAHARLPQLRALADSLNRIARYEPRAGIAQVDSIYLNAVQIEGLREVSQRLVLAELRLPAPTWVSAVELEHAMARLYSTHFFERVN